MNTAPDVKEHPEQATRLIHDLIHYDIEITEKDEKEVRNSARVYQGYVDRTVDTRNVLADYELNVATDIYHTHKGFYLLSSGAIYIYIYNCMYIVVCNSWLYTHMIYMYVYMCKYVCMVSFYVNLHRC